MNIAYEVEDQNGDPVGLLCGDDHDWTYWSADGRIVSEEAWVIFGSSSPSVEIAGGVTVGYVRDVRLLRRLGALA